MRTLRTGRTLGALRTLRSSWTYVAGVTLQALRTLRSSRTCRTRGACQTWGACVTCVALGALGSSRPDGTDRSLRHGLQHLHRWFCLDLDELHNGFGGYKQLLQLGDDQDFVSHASPPATR